MKKKSNAVMYIVLLLMLISLAGGIVGFLIDKNGLLIKKPQEEIKKEYKVNYKYYLDDVEISEMVKNETLDVPNPEFEGAVDTKAKYSYDKYTCTNEVTGEWNEETWTFTPNLTADTTCRIYFVNNFHEVTLTSINSLLPNNTNTDKYLIHKDEQKVITIIPNDGYKFDEVNKVECNKKENNENIIKTSYNNEKNELTISNVTVDDTCTIYYKVNDFTAELNVANGTATETKKNGNYGDTITFEVIPSENYRFDTVTCSNGQTATYENNMITIKGINNDTVCNVQFKPKKYSVYLEVVNGTLLNGYSSPQQTGEGGSVSFGISLNEGYYLTNAKYTCDVEGTQIFGQTGIVTVVNVHSDVKCKVEPAQQ